MRKEVTHCQHFDVCIWGQKASQRIAKGMHSDCSVADGWCEASLCSRLRPRSGGLLPVKLSTPSPHTHMHSPSLLTSVLCRAGLQVLSLPQRQGFLGLRVKAGCAELHSSLRLGPGVCPGWCVEQAFPASSSCPVGLIPPWARSPGPCTGLHGQGDGDPTLPSGRLLECPPHWPHQLGSSEMTLTDSQPCLEFTDLGLTSMVAASACSKFCCQQKRVCSGTHPG